ncbi:MAG: hypothetical protein KME26_29960 [Oscillatoria princeps RMCB-10]|nr:hypothetical protein [Oscillatoria princeps RMCB-10]
MRRAELDKSPLLAVVFSGNFPKRECWQDALTAAATPAPAARAPAAEFKASFPE